MDQKMEKLLLFASILILRTLPSLAGEYCVTYKTYGVRHLLYCIDSCCGYSASYRYCCYNDVYYFNRAYWSVGAIIGAVIGALVGLALLIALIVCICAQCNKTTTRGAVVAPAQNQTPMVTMVSNSQQQAHAGAAYPPSTSMYPPPPQPYYQGHPQPMPPPAYAENVTPGYPPYETKQQNTE